MHALTRLGLQPAQVDYVFLTHVHLDHAGGAGQLIRALPRARAVLHPRGAPHMVDPAKLIAGTVAVYGEAMYRELYGEIVPIDAGRVVVAGDGDRFALGARTFELIDSPGHARHHYCAHDLDHDDVFSGDTFGISYREFDTAAGVIFPTTTPVQFDPCAPRRSTGCGAAAAAHVLTHLGRSVIEIERRPARGYRRVRGYRRRHAAYEERPDRRRRVCVPGRARLTRTVSPE
jgi:hypothetical protein